MIILMLWIDVVIFINKLKIKYYIKITNGRLKYYKKLIIKLF